MTWKLFLDDQLDDPDAPARHTPDGFIGAKSVEEAKELVRVHGLPFYMDLDHDLADGFDCPAFLTWLAYQFFEFEPPKYKVHSANPVGRKRIESVMESWIKAQKMG